MDRRTLSAAVVGALLSLPLVAVGGSAAQADAEECALGVESDFNGDGRADLVVVNFLSGSQPALSVLLNDGIW